MRSATAPAPSRSSSRPASDPNPDAAGFGVYVHWPFCTSKCPYCDFNSHVRAGGIDEAGFRDALAAEVRATADEIGPRTVSSIFLGGGTPSLMQPATVARILEAIGKVWTLTPDAEVTLEANPGSVEAARFAGYRAAGVNRVSLGVQALRDDALRALGRLHTVAEARSALAIAAATFERWSFDLIYARPAQTLADWRAELTEALAFAGGHLSLYQLTLEPGTPFTALHAAGKLAVPDAETADALYAITQELTEAAGRPAYEVSNHARPGAESLHNLLYWRYGEYAGIGPGAHGRLIRAGARAATVNEPSPEAWRSAVGVRGTGRTADEPLTRAERADEALLMGLRLAEGLDLGRLAALGGVVPDRKAVERLAQLGLVTHGAERLIATRRGRFVLNTLAAELSAALVPASPA